MQTVDEGYSFALPSAHYSSAAPVQHANLDSNGGQWNCVPPYAGSSHQRISPSDTRGSRHEMNQFHIGGSSAEGRDSLFNRHHHVSSSQSLHGHHAPPMREEHVNHTRRAEPSYGNGSRNSRHYSPGGWRSSYRSGRPTIESHDRMGHETIVMADRAPFYGNSTNFSDQYRDLRLDEEYQKGDKIGAMENCGHDYHEDCIKK
nr:hypothetical protein [Tanacetum cinerariifolium]